MGALSTLPDRRAKPWFASFIKRRYNEDPSKLRHYGIDIFVLSVTIQLA
jgi:hypothetical protein